MQWHWHSAWLGQDRRLSPSVDTGLACSHQPCARRSRCAAAGVWQLQVGCLGKAGLPLHMSSCRLQHLQVHTSPAGEQSGADPKGSWCRAGTPGMRGAGWPAARCRWCASCCVPGGSSCTSHPAGLAQGGDAWDARGRLACRALSVVRQLLYLVPRADNAQEVLRGFVASSLQALQALTAHSRSGAPWRTEPPSASVRFDGQLLLHRAQGANNAREAVRVFVASCCCLICTGPARRAMGTTCCYSASAAGCAQVLAAPPWRASCASASSCAPSPPWSGCVLLPPALTCAVVACMCVRPFLQRTLLPGLQLCPLPCKRCECLTLCAFSTTKRPSTLFSTVPH